MVGGSGQWGVMGEGHISAVCVRHGTGVASVRGGQSVLSIVCGAQRDDRRAVMCSSSTASGKELSALSRQRG